jgi:phosphohistidine phosphatase
MSKTRPAYYYEQSAVVPVIRAEDETLQVVLITTRKGKHWIVPKGIIETGMTAAESALKEAEEEAGLSGMASEEPIGVYSYEKWGGECEVEVFVMSVQEMKDSWEEDFRERCVVPVVEAEHLVKDQALKELIVRIPQWIEVHGLPGKIQPAE